MNGIQDNKFAQNPFFIGKPVPPDQFIGRKEEIYSAFDQIVKRSHCAIWGDLGMGKSSILKYLASAQAWEERGLKSELSKTVIIRLNCSDIEPFTPVQFWERVLNDKLIHELLTGVGAEELFPRQGKELLQQVLRKMEQQEKFLVLLIDNYDLALQSHANYTENEMKSFLSQMRNLANGEHPNLSTVVTSTKPLNELNPNFRIEGSPWYNYYLYNPLKPFKDDDVTALLNKLPCPGLSKPEKGDRDQYIRELADGHPALLQNVLYSLYNALRSGNKLNPEEFKRDCLNRARGILSRLWENSTQDQRNYLLCLSLSNPVVRQARQHQESWRAIDRALSQMKGSRFDLEQRGIIKQTTTEEKTVVSFNSALMDQWVRHRIQYEDSQDIRNLENVLFGVCRGDLKKLTEHIDLMFPDKLISIIQLIVGVKNGGNK